MYLNLYVIPAIVACFFSMFIGIYVFSKNPRNKQNRVFTLLALWLVVFCVGEAMLRLSSSSEEGYLWAKIGYSGAIFSPLVFYHLSFIFPMERRIFKKQKIRNNLLTISYITGFFVFLLFNLIVSVKDVQFSDLGYRLDLTSATSFVGAWIIILLITSVINLLKNYQNSKSLIEKKQIVNVFYGAFIGIILTIPTNVILPMMGIKIFPMSVIAIPIFCLFVGTAILKHSLFVYRPMTETFIKPEKMVLLNRDELEKEVKTRTAALLIANEKLKIQIAKRKNTEEKIKQQNIELKKLNRIKSEFLNVTSHELRTPMASIKGYIQMLLKLTLGNITVEQKKALDVVLRNTDRLDHLVQDILDSSQLQSGSMKFVPEQTDIRKMINESIETMQSFADLKDKKIIADVEDKIPELFIDEKRITQVIINLVNNAIKFSPDGSIIKIRAKKEDTGILFEVQDFGQGIPKDKQEKIFDTFYQIDSSIVRSVGGIGLGLAISRGIVLAHGGRIWVESETGKGSTFKFKLPIQPVKAMEERFKEIDMFSLESEK